MELWSELHLIALWICIWGITDTLLNIFIDYNNHSSRLCIYIVLLVLLVIYAKIYRYN